MHNWKENLFSHKKWIVLTKPKEERRLKELL